MTILPLFKPSGKGGTSGLVGAFSIVLCLKFLAVSVLDVDCKEYVFRLVGVITLLLASLPLGEEIDVICFPFR